MFRRSKSPSLAPLLLDSHQRMAEQASRLHAQGQFLEGAKLLGLALEAGKVLHSNAIFKALGPLAWRQNGFSRLTLRSLERCDTPGGAACLLEWRAQASACNALPHALGLSGHARGKALAAIADAPFWRHESETHPLASEALAGLLVSCVEQHNFDEAAASLRAALPEWLNSGRPIGQAAGRLACMRLSSHPAWLHSVGRPCAVDILTRSGFARAAPTLMLALGEPLFRALSVSALNESISHWAAREMDEGAWRYCLGAGIPFGPNEHGDTPLHLLADASRRLHRSDLARELPKLGGMIALAYAHGAASDAPNAQGQRFMDLLPEPLRSTAESHALREILGAEGAVPLGGEALLRAL